MNFALKFIKNKKKYFWYYILDINLFSKVIRFLKSKFDFLQDVDDESIILKAKKKKSFQEVIDYSETCLEDMVTLKFLLCF